jgi:ribosomal protein S18 acetylase RimI-like enzyme
MESVKLKSSSGISDIDQVMKIVATFGADDENLAKIKEYILTELRELGENRVLYFLESGPDVVGMVQIIFKRDEENTAHVHGLQVAKDKHRLGYGEHLMRLVEQKVQEAGVRRLTLGVDADNEKALNLYKKLGYSRFKVIEGRSSGVDLYYLQKSLS